MEKALLSNHRDPETYGDVQLSVQAGKYLYCTPEQDGLPIAEYSKVEIGLLLNDKLVCPSAVGLPEFQAWFEDGERPVAGWITQARLEILRKALTARAQGSS
jgi:hypothetical protein